MNWNIVEENWKQFKGKVQAWWCKFTGDHSCVIAGKRAGLGGQIQGASSKEGGEAKKEMLSRRALLRGALAVGCSLLLPASFSVNAAPATGANPAAPAAAKKVTKASVHYQTHPKGEQKCSRCANFIAESKTCKRVEGQINPEGWCVLWMKKA